MILVRPVPPAGCNKEQHRYNKDCLRSRANRPGPHFSKATLPTSTSRHTGDRFTVRGGSALQPSTIGGCRIGLVGRDVFFVRFSVASSAASGGRGPNPFLSSGHSLTFDSCAGHLSVGLLGHSEAASVSFQCVDSRPVSVDTYHLYSALPHSTSPAVLPQNRRLDPAISGPRGIVECSWKRHENVALRM